MTLERCERSCGGALCRNSHRAVITNDALPIATDRPMGGRFPGDIPRVTFSRSRVNICQTPSSGRAVVHKLPTVGSQSVGYHQMPLETDYHTAVGSL